MDTEAWGDEALINVIDRIDFRRRVEVLFVTTARFGANAKVKIMDPNHQGTA